MLAVWILGIALIVQNPGVAAGKWIWVKLVLVLGMTALHGMFVGMGKKIDKGEGAVSEKKLRMLNEVPFVLLIVVVLLAVLKPF